MSHRELVTLGRLRLVAAEGELLSGRRKELALLAFLARRSPRAVSRDELAALLWGERDERRARESLRQALLRLRRSLGDAIAVTPWDVSLREGAIALDVRRFELLIEQGDQAGAVRLWHGDFLADGEGTGGEEYRLWVERERVALRRLLAHALERLTASAAARGDAVERHHWAARRCELFPYDEPACLEQARALLATGRPDDAAALLEAFATRLQDDLGVGPTAEALALEERLRQRTTMERHPGSAALLTPDLVGRDSIVTLLTDLAKHPGEGGAVVLIEGEEGIGKTRLCTEVARRIRDSGEPTVILEARGDERDTGIPMATARALLTGLKDAPSVLDVPSRAWRNVVAIAPALRARFPGLPDASGPPDDAAGAVRQVLGAIAATTRIVVIADDVPAADHDSRELIRTLIRAAIPSTLFILTAKTGQLDDSPLAPELARLPTARRVKLQPLRGAEVEAMVASMLELDSGECAELARRLVAVCGGNPFYITELVSALADDGVLALNADGRWQVTPSRSLESLPLPNGVRGAVERRLAVLTPTARRVLDVAAVCGGEVTPAVLESVADVALGDVSAALDELIGRRVLRERPAPDPSYGFAHDLVRRAVYEAIPRTRREALHASVYSMLAGAADGIDRPTDQLEYHRSRAGSALRVAAPPRATRRRAMIVAASVVGLVSALAIWRMDLARPRTAAAGPIQRRLVVIPLENRSGLASLDPLAHIAADWITQGVARTGLAVVVPYQLVSQPDADRRASGGSAAQSRLLGAATEARADLAISGSYFVVNDSLHFEVGITDVRRGTMLAVVRPDPGHRSTPMALVDSLRKRTVATVVPFLDARLAASAEIQGAPPSFEAYQLFATGLELFIDRRIESIGHFLRAYELDSTYTLPLVYAAMQYESIGALQALDSVTRRLLPRRAELPPFERSLLDHFRWRLDGDLSRALQAARIATSIAPASLTTRMYRAVTAIGLNRPHEAIEVLRDLDPELPHDRGGGGPLAVLAGAYHMVGDFERQLAIGRVIQRFYPEDVRHYSHRARAFAALGRFAELDAVLEQSLLEPDVPWWGSPGLSLHVVIADELRAHGNEAHGMLVLERAVRFYERAPDELKREPGYQLDLARAYVRAGRLADARRLMNEVAAREGTDSTVTRSADFLGELGFVAALQGDQGTVAEVRRQLARMQSPFLQGAQFEYLAGIAALCGEKEEAMELLQKAVAAGRSFDSGKHIYFSLAPLRGYPPFERWLRPKG